MSENKQKEEKPKDKLLIAHTSNFNLLFTSEEVNGKTLSIFRPKQTDKDDFRASIIVAKDPTQDAHLIEPTDYKKVAEVYGKKTFTIWEPVPPQDYVAMGCVANEGTTKPPYSLVRCVKKTLTTETKAGDLIFEGKGSKDFWIWSPKLVEEVYKSGLSFGTLDNKGERATFSLISKGNVLKLPVPSQIEHHESISKSFSTWIENKTFADTKIHVGGKTLMAHSVFLTGRSNIEGEVTIDPKYDYETFSTLLKYLYTGKANINHNNVFQVLSCADKYGVVTLRDGCFDFLLWSVDKDSVCQMMMKGKRKEFEFDATQLIEKCIGYIENQAYEVVQSSEFLKLDQDLVVSIYKNEKIVCEEIDLFNAALKWGKNQKGELKEVLAPILEHVRFPLMNPDDLLKIVKPTGLVDKVRYLEAIEYVSVPKAFKDRKDIQFKERFRIFHGTTVLENSQSLKINEWIGIKKTQEWKCLYRASKDGFQANTFHQKCDGKGPTVTVIKTTNGNIFGAYSPCKWSSNGSYQYDQKSFIFSLVNTIKKPFKVIHSGSNLNSIYCSGGYGPTFGSGHDLHICNSSNTNSGSYSNFGYSFPVTEMSGYQYGSNNVKNILAGSYNFLTTEIEVYEIM